MRALLHLWARFKHLRWGEVGRLILLGCTICFFVSACVCLDVAIPTLFLNQVTVMELGAEYLLAAFFWFLAGLFALKAQRRRGYGAFGMMIGCFALLLSAVLGYRQGWRESSLHFLFAGRYAFFFLGNCLFWSLASRFIKLSMSSLKFLGVFGFEILGLLLGAGLTFYVVPEQLLVIALGGWALCCVFFKVLALLQPVPPETFIRKSGGVQDFDARMIAQTILALSFCWMSARLLIEAQLYRYILDNDFSIQKILSRIYLVFSISSLFLLACFVRTRFLYTMSLGLIACVAAVGCCALGSLFSDTSLLLGGVVCFLISSHFYVHRYLSLLSRILAQSHGMRIKKTRYLLMIPSAFIFVGALLLTVSTLILQWILFVHMILLAFLFVVSGHLYGRQLMRMCALRMWREGPFMLAYPPLKQMMNQGLSKKSAAEAVYFLHILDEGAVREYRGILCRMLHHPSVTARLFVLKKMDKLSLTPKERQRIVHLMSGDSCAEVQNCALAVLIRDALESNSTAAWHDYQKYLNERKWLVGACCGFLSGRGGWLEKVISVVLKLADSKKIADQLDALNIMAVRPRFEWTESLSHLLYSSDDRVIKKAIVASGCVASPILLNRLLPMLDEIRWRDAVLEAIEQYGKRAFPAIEKMILAETIPLDRQKMLILFLSRLQSGEGKQILLRVLFKANPMLRQSIVEGLSDSGIIWVQKGKRKILTKVIHQTVQDWFDIRKMLIQTENLEKGALQEVKKLFQEALQEQLVHTRSFLLEQLTFYTSIPLAVKAVAILKEDDLNAFAAAVGCLQDILPKSLYLRIREILLYPTWNDPPENLKFISAFLFLSGFLLTPPSWSNPWLQALALYGLRELGDKKALMSIQEGLKSSNRVVLETALSALGRLEKDKIKVAQQVLNVPTRYLLQQNFEDLLEVKNARHN